MSKFSSTTLFFPLAPWSVEESVGRSPHEGPPCSRPVDPSMTRHPGIPRHTSTHTRLGNQGKLDSCIEQN